MIEVTRLNKTKLTINALFIETMEATPDTVITMTTGKKLVVLESVDDVVDLVRHYLRSIGATRASVMFEHTEGS
ncbi:flagellar FlbD family protein [Paenibacillus turpanensis]|uniref:flagellar FlbD family protein n=1 Tax=Paenibacillus turpanensis TaxID=2689078 RepID=UPI001407A05D|nr:flagellar FlbD family protein [Paenibacillus turpanensis]